jgi:hypothetical protein
MLFSRIRTEARAIPDDVVLDAARCWRSARDEGRPAQPCLYEALAPHGLEMLAPVFDSLLAISEHCLERPLCTGCPLAPSADETLICRLLEDPSHLDRIAQARGCPRAPGDLTGVLVCALRSTRVMMAMAAREEG